MQRYRRFAVGGAVVYDVRRCVDEIADDASLRDFTHPSPTREPLEAVLFRPDGTQCTRRLSPALRQLPTEILYDAVGLDLFDQITKLPEYYPTRCEREILIEQFGNMVPFIPDGTSIVELGCGNMSKTMAILDHLYDAKKRNVHFYALDIDATYLGQSVVALVDAQKKRQIEAEYSITYAGILGSYDEALDSILSDVPGPKVFLWLGSSIGNCTREGAEDLVGRFSAVMQPGERFIVGIDNRNDPATVAAAYNDAQGITAKFGLNGIHHLNRRFGDVVFDPKNFEYYAGYNPVEGRHEAYYRSLADHVIHLPATASEAAADVRLKKFELIRYEMSCKYSLDDIRALTQSTGFRLKDFWMDAGNMYRLCLFEKSESALMTSPMPTVQDWRDAWHRWDVVGRPTMIQDHHRQPILLRHPYVFYLGHIPTFCDVLLSKGLNLSLTEPAYYKDIFERGIDPDVENPDICHPHSAVPDAWPDIEAIQDYKRRVRARVMDIYMHKETDALTVSPRQLGRILHMAFEHELMHTETLLHMVVQDTSVDKSVHQMSFHSTSKQLSDSKWLTVDGGDAVIGMDHGEETDATEDEIPESFGWDNESPKRSTNVASFQIQHRPVTNVEYLCFLKTLPSMPEDLIPKSFGKCKDSNTFGVKTVSGVVSMTHSMNWPAALNYHQASAYMKHLQISLKDTSIHIPSEAELVRFYDAFGSSIGSDANVGFRNWHPLDLNNDDVHVMGSMWEWTSTPLSAHDGFVSSALYPGYSTDFFNGKHNVVRGASWATHPRLVGRFRNFYQQSYGFAFTGVRFVRCLEE